MNKYRMPRQSKRQQGGIQKNLLNKIMAEYGEQGDLNLFYDRFFWKRVNEAKGALDGVVETSGAYESVPSPSSTVSNSILVIDMQNDFMLAPCGAPGVPSYPKCGTFNVANGESVVSPLNAWIQSNMSKLNKLVFSRDSHDPYHCSYKSQGGIFPDHCQMNSSGAAIHDGFKLPEYIDDTSGKVQVIFKGMDRNVDSFGASKYHAGDAHAASRQVGSCCTEVGGPGSSGCSDLTGGFYMEGAPNTHTFHDTPFSGKYDWYKKRENFKPFQVADLLNGQTSGEHNVYIVGLAGDWCVRDTAYNIGKLGAVNGVKINVYVVQEFVRYAFVPVWAVATTDLAKLQSTQPEKSLVDYAFKFDPFPKWRQLLRNELTSITNANLKVGGPIFHFITDPKDILQNYKEAGVKLCLLPGMEALQTNKNFLGNSNVRNTKNSTAALATFAAEQEQVAAMGGRRKTRNKRTKTSKTKKNRRRV
jgi:nicotinamidase-related amidase